MFVQVIQGATADPVQVRTALDRWLDEVAVDAAGWLGSTSGVSEDGQLIAVVRFESEQAARRNSDRPEQSAWWADMASLFTDEPRFLESSDVIVDVVGDPDEAGFVQVMQGQGSDSDRARELMGQGSAEWAWFRPDILGSLVALHGEGRYTMVIYFTSELAAREGETKEPPAELAAQMQEMTELMTGPPEFHDLRQPWLDSPK